jgi:hypothetical protein
MTSTRIHYENHIMTFIFQDFVLVNGMFCDVVRTGVDLSLSIRQVGMGQEEELILVRNGWREDRMGEEE